MGWVFGSAPRFEEVVVCGFEAAERRAATFSGEVFLSRDWWRGEKKLCMSR